MIGFHSGRCCIQTTALFRYSLAILQMQPFHSSLHHFYCEVTLSAGLATVGYTPVIPLYSSFLQRAYDQTLHDVCLQKLHVVFPIDRAGIVGADGETHQGVYDISYLSHMPNMTILSPATLDQLEYMLDFAINKFNAPIAIRYPRGGTEAENVPSAFTLGQAQCIQNGSDVTIIATGRMVKRAEEVAKLTTKSIEILAMPTIKPLQTKDNISNDGQFPSYRFLRILLSNAFHLQMPFYCPLLLYISLSLPFPNKQVRVLRP